MQIQFCININLDFVNVSNHAIISIVEKVNIAMDSGKISIGVFLDLRKAFDTVVSLYPTRQTLQIWYSRNTLELV